MAEINERILPLDELDGFQVAEGDPDVRGWQVCDAGGERIGEVDELLVDTEALKVRYLDVELDDSSVADDRHILIPVGYARLHERDDRILVDTLDRDRLSSLPPYSQEPLTREYETTILQRFGPAAPRPSPSADLYAGDEYDDSRFYAPRRRSVEE
ncbi:MAG TPA: PRC-barrel domain-containing protein [Longimicrobiaceae bacterium]